MTEGSKFLTPEEVSQRYRGEVSVGTLRNWRVQRIGPDYVKIGRSVLYPLEKLVEWDRRNTVVCSPLSVQPIKNGDSRDHSNIAGKSQSSEHQP